MKNLKFKVQAVAAFSFLLASAAAFADDSTYMAPPVDDSSGYTSSFEGAAPSNKPTPSASTVFNWSEVPANQQVPINRAVFDQNGYQLYDSVGETIIVPFTNHNLYVMKFAVSETGDAYFINTGNEPTFYLPSDGFLENASVAGAKWYPFNDNFHPATPVFVGCAPSWDSFTDIGWYPGMACYGGYWGEESYYDGGFFQPCFGLFFEIGGDRCYGWNGYRNYYYGHPGWNRIGSYHPEFYRYAEGPHYGRGFGGGGYSHGGGNINIGININSNNNRGGFNGGGYNNGGGFNGGGYPHTGSAFAGNGPHATLNGSNGGRVFRGAGGGGGYPVNGGGNGGFSGVPSHPFVNGAGGSSNFDDGSRWAHRSFEGATGGSAPTDTHSYSGATLNGGDHSFSGGSSSGHSFGGGSSGGDRSSGGGSFSGGGDHSSGGGFSGGDDHGSGGGFSGGGDHGGGGFGGVPSHPR